MQLLYDLNILKMKLIEDLTRVNIRNLKAYSSARDEYQGNEGIFLDANENPYGELNRYPDPYQKELKLALAEIKNISAENIFIGNGSDEIIDLAFRIFCTPGRDKAVTISPSYGMYDVVAGLNNISLEKLELEKDFSIDIKKLREALSGTEVKLFILCSPNNPTANAFPKKELLEVLKDFKGIVLIDEAYIDFSKKESWVNELTSMPNLLVSQTFSKSMGLAAARVGVAYSDIEVIKIFNRVKPPYNVSTLNQQAAIDALKNLPEKMNQVAQILLSREHLITGLSQLPVVRKIYPSDANFLLVEFENGPEVFKTLKSKRIITRNRNSMLKNCIRISVGTENENDVLIRELKNISK